MFGEVKLNQLWVEKYRPVTLDDYICNGNLKNFFNNIIESGSIPNLLLCGNPGEGKTTAIKILINSIEGIDPGDIMELNMSERGVDDLREVLDFIKTRPFGWYKVIILEECEAMSLKAQQSLKRITEENSDVARFILTSNEPNKIIPPIRSRMQTVSFKGNFTLEDFSTRVINILIQENVQISTDDDINLIDRYIKSTYPDFRKCINTLQQNCFNGKINELNSSTSSTADFEFQIINAINSNNLMHARKSIVENIREDDIPSFFTFLYNNLDIWIPEHLKGSDDAEFLKMQLLVKIKNGLVNDSLVACREINLSAVLCELQLVVREFN